MIAKGGSGLAENLGASDAGREPRKLCGTALIKAGQPADQEARRPGAAPVRIGQDRDELGGFLGVEVADGFGEGPAGASLGAELAVWTQFNDVEVNFQDP